MRSCPDVLDNTSADKRNFEAPGPTLTGPSPKRPFRQPTGSIHFIDRGSSDLAYVSVRRDDDRVAMARSLKFDGDMEVCLSKDAAIQLLELLKLAIA